MTQYTEKDMTPWFPAGTRPQRSGVYSTRLNGGDGNEFFQNWSGSFWGYYCATPARAEAESNSAYVSKRQNPEWRGLSFDPSKEAK